MTKNKTLIFCTSFADTYQQWENRYKIWFNFVKNSGLEKDQILIIDDGSPVLPNWTDLKICKEPLLPESVNDKYVLFQFSSRLGRRGLLDYPGWYRSYIFAGVWAKQNNFNKIIHIESDSFIFSEQLIEHINALSSGWTSLYCPSQNLPENCIQIICEDQIKKFLKFGRHDYDINFANKPIELLIPYTNIEKGFVGDRYGELIGVTGLPSGIDYAANIPSGWLKF